MIREHMLYLGLFFLMAVMAPPLHAQENPLELGVNWLASTQNGDGSWGGEAGSLVSPISSSFAVLQTLGTLDRRGTPEYARGLAWLEDQALETTDHLAQRIRARASAGLDLDPLISLRLTGPAAWGGCKGYSENTLDTATVLQAVSVLEPQDLKLIRETASYLIAAQNPDGGWGFISGTESNIYVTAVVSLSLQCATAAADLSSAITKASTFLATHQNADGGFGGSSVFETSLAALSLMGAVNDGTILGAAKGYLLRAQTTDGSWGGDAFSTALALRVLYLAKFKPPAPPLPTKGSIVGRVIDVAWSNPLSGVTVVVEDLSDRQTATDASGLFTLSSLPAGSHTLLLSIPGYRSETAAADVKAGAVVDIGTLSLQIGSDTAVIKGSVSDAQTDLPIEGALIQVAGSPSIGTLSRGDGSFILTGIAPGAVSLTVSRDGYCTMAASGTAVGGRILFFTPRLSTEPPSSNLGSLKGTVLDASTLLPIPGAVLSIEGLTSVSTGPARGFLIEQIPTGSIALSVSASGYLNRIYQVMIAPGVISDLQEITLAATGETVTIRGTVREAVSNRGIAGARVIVLDNHLSTVADEAGDYSLKGLPPGEFQIMASAACYDSSITGFSASRSGAFQVDFALEPTPAASARILSLETNKPEYGADEPVSIIATIENLSSSPMQVFSRVSLIDPQGEILAVTGPSGDAQTTFTPGDPQEAAFMWNTRRYSPGTYRAAVSVIDSRTGILLVEDSTAFHIRPTLSLSQTVDLTAPRFFPAGTRQEVRLALYLVNGSNTDAQLSASYRIVTPRGDELKAGDLPFHLGSEEDFKKVLLGTFSHEFSESGSYPVQIGVASQDGILAEVKSTIHVAPLIRLEPTLSPRPETVTPDGDKRIRIDLSIKGVEERP